MHHHHFCTGPHFACKMSTVYSIFQMMNFAFMNMNVGPRKTKSGYWDITQKGGILVFEIGVLDINSQNWDIDLNEIGILKIEIGISGY